MSQGDGGDGRGPEMDPGRGQVDLVAPSDPAHVPATGLVPYRPAPRPPLRIEWPADPDRPGQPVRLPDRWCFLGVFLISLVIFISADTGRIIFDTKLGVDIDAGGFLARLWQLWNPLEWFGTLQNQYIGYAIPMAPFYLLGQAAHLPVWIIERLWLTTLVTVGFAGLVRLARCLGVGTDGTRLLAAAVYVAWPTFTIVIGSSSAAAVPGLMLPWAILPLVGAARGDRPAARAVALSGLAVTAMGGVNAASTGYVLIAPALFILIKTRGRLRISLLVKWIIAVLAGTAWWLLPLLLQGKYSFNFLPYIEQSATTFGTMSAAAFLRGAGNWTAYLNLGTPWLSAGWSDVTTPVAIVGSAVAAGAGLYGLARRDMPERRWLLASVGLAAAVALSGYWGPAGAPLSGVTDAAFNGAVAPLRSVYKLEPVVALALALGVAHALSRWSRVELPVRAGRVPASAVIAPLAALALVGLAVPQLTGQILQPGSFSSVPAYWYQVADYLAAHAPRQAALVVPGDSHGVYLWGDPIDEPLEPLASSPWVERSIVPYGGAGSQVFLNTAEQAVESGQDVPGLPAYLARAGVRYVVVRNDLDPAEIGYISPQIVNETLAQSGFERVVSFGPRIQSSASYSQPAPSGKQPSYPAVEVFQAANPGWRPASPVTALATSGTVLVNGGPDSLLQLAGQGIVTTQPAVIAGDPLPVRPSTWAITDGQRREDDDFSLPTQNLSFTYTATETNPPDSPLGGAGDPPRQLLPVPAAGHQTVAVLSGAARVTASSYGNWLTEEPQYDPVNAFDGNRATAWAEGSAVTPVGQWIQVTFDHSRDLPSTIGIQLLTSGTDRSVATQVRVSTAAGTVTTNLARTSATQPVRVRPGSSDWLRITIARATIPLAGGPGAGFTGVLIPGVTVTRYLQPAEDPAGSAAPSVVYSFSQQVASPAVATGPQPSAVLARTFQVPAAQRLTVTGLAVATAAPGAALDRLIGELDGLNVTPRNLAANVTFACGEGPTIRVDGENYPTTVSGTLADLIQRRPVQVRLCSSGSQLVLGAGQHWLEAKPSGAFVVTDLDLRAGAAAPAATAAPAAGTQRSLRVRSWSDDDRSVRIGPGAQSYVEIHENFNAGWKATLDGRSLTAVELDGWQQAFIVPAGQGGLITLKYTPVTVYHAGLIASAVALVVLAVVAILPGQWRNKRRQRRRDRRDKRRAARQRRRDARREPGPGPWEPELGPTEPSGPRRPEPRSTHPESGPPWARQPELARSEPPWARRPEPGEPESWWAQPWHLPEPAAPESADTGPQRAKPRGPGPRGWIPGRPAARAIVLLIPLALVIGIAGGPVVVAVPVAACVAYWRPRWLPWVALGAMLVAGVVAATGHHTTTGSGAFSGLAQVCALVALTAALMPGITRTAPGAAGQPEDAP